MHSTVVVFPAPLAPISPTISPAGTSRSSPSTTTLLRYALRSPRTVTTCVLLMPTIVPVPARQRVSPRLEPELYPRVENLAGLHVDRSRRACRGGPAASAGIPGKVKAV